MDFAVPAKPKSKTKKTKREVSTKTLLENRKKTMEHEIDGNTGTLDTVNKRLVQGQEYLDIRLLVGWI